MVRFAKLIDAAYASPSDKRLDRYQRQTDLKSLLIVTRLFRICTHANQRQRIPRLANAKSTLRFWRQRRFGAHLGYQPPDERESTRT